MEVEKNTYVLNVSSPFVDDSLRVDSVRIIFGHLSKSSKYFTVQRSQGMVRIDGNGNPGQVGRLK